MIGEVGRMQAVVVNYSDVPEWASMIANVRSWWRSYPWMVTYPGIAFFISILAFNLTGEGLRRFLDDSQVNLSRLFNRYTFVAGIGVLLIFNLILQSNSPLSVYRPEARKFNAESVLKLPTTLPGEWTRSGCSRLERVERIFRTLPTPASI
jgi:hypothetical protein